MSRRRDRRRGAQAARRRCRHCRRRRVRQADGGALRLRRLVELRLRPHGGIRLAGLGAGIQTKKIERRGSGVHDLRQSPRLAEIFGFLPGPGIDRHARRQCRAPASAPSGLHRPHQIYRPSGDRSRHRSSEKGDGRGRCRRGFHVLDRAGQLRAQRGHALQQSGRVRLRRGRCDARRIQGDRRRRPGAADRRPEPSRQLGHDQSGAAARGVQEVRARAHGSAQSRVARPAGRPRALSHLLGKLARPAHHRHSARPTSSISCSA